MHIKERLDSSYVIINGNKMISKKAVSAKAIQKDYRLLGHPEYQIISMSNLLNKFRLTLEEFESHFFPVINKRS